MAKRVAVVTDAGSAGEFFPYWRRYYGDAFGAANLYVATYGDRAAAFAGIALGGVLRLEAAYSDPLRSALIGRLVSELLQRYDVVIRCDVDEFLIPHPRRARSLSDYVQSLVHDHVTALGFDVIETEDEPPLRLDGAPLLGQRRFCVGATALCKTAIVTRPLAWSVGFHFADAPPILDDLLMFHFKFADIGRRAAWFSQMLALCAPGSSESEYYADGLAKLSASLKALVALPRRLGGAAFDSPDFFAARFLNSVEPQEGDALFTFPFVVDQAAREIPEPLRAAV